MNRAAASDKAIIVDILAASFQNNQSVNAVVRQDHKRLARIHELMDYSYELCNLFGEVWISNDKKACALFLFPDKKRTTLRTILLDFNLATKVIGIERIGEVLKRESMIKSNHPSSPFAYLWFIGVHPDSQGNGLGSELLRNLITECNLKQRPVYLETSVERNLPFYKKFGFEIYQTLNPGYTLYQLRRL